MTRAQEGLFGGLLALMALNPTIAWAEVIDFEDMGAGLAAESHWDGKERYDANDTDLDGTFTSGGFTFDNHYDEVYGPYWDGFAYSNHTYDVDIPPKGLGAQYHAVPNVDSVAPNTFGVGFMGFGPRNPTIELPESAVIESAMITNNNYAYYSMLEGDQFAKKFGGELGGEEDWLLLTITGKDASQSETGSVDFYLADYRFVDDALDYIVDDWTYVDLSSLAGSRFLEFTLMSTDLGYQNMMNTPGYFAIDNITTADVPEPSSLVMLFGAVGGLALAVLRRRRRKSARMDP